MTGPEGNSKFCFRETLIEVEGKQNSLFPAPPVIKCFVIPSSSKVETKTAKKSFALRRLAQKFDTVLKSTTWSRASWKFMLLFRELVSLTPRHVTRFPPIKKRIWVGRYSNAVYFTYLNTACTWEPTSHSKPGIQRYHAPWETSALWYRLEWTGPL